MKIFVLILMLVSANGAIAQEKNKNWAMKADKFYRDSNYAEAEEFYRKASPTGLDFNSQYNIGNSLYQQGRFAEAKVAYEKASGSKDAIDNKKAMAFHNLGNSLMNSKDYEGAMKNYIEALKLQPSDQDTKQNLAKAIQLKKIEQKQQQKKDQEKQDQNKDQNKQDQKQNQDQQQKENKKDDPKQNSSNKNQKEEESKPEKEQDQSNQNKKLNKEEADQLLKMVEAKDRKAKEKMQMINKRKKAKDKDW
ncbi:MAG: tetratricopeptide repeat protein [Saprospiraceae bacterium]